MIYLTLIFNDRKDYHFFNNLSEAIECAHLWMRHYDSIVIHSIGQSMQSIWSMPFKGGKILTTAEWQSVPFKINVYGSNTPHVYILPANTEFKRFDTENFGWVVVKKTPETKSWNHRIFKY